MNSRETSGDKWKKIRRKVLRKDKNLQNKTKSTHTANQGKNLESLQSIQEFETKEIYYRDFPIEISSEIETNELLSNNIIKNNRSMSYSLRATESTTENDSVIAEALAREEQMHADAEYARQLTQQENPTQRYNNISNNQGGFMQSLRSVTGAYPRANSNSTTANCPGRHGLTQFMVSNAQRVTCDKCLKRLNEDENVYSCIICNHDICPTCYYNPSAPVTTPATANAPRNNTNTSSNSTPFSFPSPFTNNNSAFQFPIPNYEPPTHMCLVPCEIGKGVCVEMLVDTGAQSSVISYALAQRLNIHNRLDRSSQGVAAGVGQAKIIGKLRNVACTLGQIEFAMDFIVLDVRDQLLLLGLDQMRKYKCIVDLERNVLIFGGFGGVELPLLPADQIHINMRRQLDQVGCPMM